jgi:hypothetical protein
LNITGQNSWLDLLLCVLTKCDYVSLKVFICFGSYNVWAYIYSMGRIWDITFWKKFYVVYPSSIMCTCVYLYPRVFFFIFRYYRVVSLGSRDKPTTAGTTLPLEWTVFIYLSGFKKKKTSKKIVSWPRKYAITLDCLCVCVLWQQQVFLTSFFFFFRCLYAWFVCSSTAVFRLEIEQKAPVAWRTAYLNTHALFPVGKQ